MLEFLKAKNAQNYKITKAISNMEPLYQPHDFWDIQPVPKAYEERDETKYD